MTEKKAPKGDGVAAPVGPKHPDRKVMRTSIEGLSKRHIAEVYARMQYFGLPGNLAHKRPLGKDELFDLVEEVEYRHRNKLRHVTPEKQIGYIRDFVMSGGATDLLIVGGETSQIFAQWVVHTLIWWMILNDTCPKIKWMPVYGSTFQMEVNQDDWSTGQRPDLIVLTNLTADSTNWKIERVVDIMERFQVPTVITVGGNPMDFGKRIHNVPSQLLYFL